MDVSRDTRVGSCPSDPAHAHDHLVEFYETEGFLAASVVGFLGPALADGDAAVVVATPEHRVAFLRGFRDAGHDVDALQGAGRLVLLDAATLLGEFMVDGTPDRDRFRASVEPVLDAATADGRTVRVYGEMVALLWAAGDVASVMRLEDHWNDLGADRPFRLLCAYPLGAFDGQGSVEAFRRICDRHSTVVPAESYTLLRDDDARARHVSRLQQEVGALREELDDLRDQRAALAELAYVDPLTGLANRRAFDRELAREWTLARDGDVDSQLVVADLDGFKVINDGLGHAAGDEVLRRFAHGLRGCARPSDVVARIGGDEFAVLLLRCTPTAAARVVEEVTRATAGIVVGGRPLGCAFGHVSLADSGSPAHALARADLAMFARKRAPLRIAAGPRP